MNWANIAGIVRHILTFGAGYLVSAGIFDSATADTAVGALVALIGVVWSVLAKRNATPPAA